MDLNYYFYKFKSLKYTYKDYKNESDNYIKLHKNIQNNLHNALLLLNKINNIDFKKIKNINKSLKNQFNDVIINSNINSIRRWHDGQPTKSLSLMALPHSPNQNSQYLDSIDQKTQIPLLDHRYSIKLTDYVECCDNSHSNI